MTRPVSELPVSLPLVEITRLFERLSQSSPHQLALVLGRRRLSHVLDKGHEHGLLTAGQGNLVHELLHESSLRASEIMTPVDRVLGLKESATREELSAFARDYGLTHITIRKADLADGWFGYIRWIDLERRSDEPRDLIREMPRIAHDATRLTALLALRVLLPLLLIQLDRFHHGLSGMAELRDVSRYRGEFSN